MVYTTAATVREALGNDNLGVAGGIILDDGQLTYLIKLGSAKVNHKLRISTDITTDPDLTVVEGIVIDLIYQHIMRNRHLKENNEVENISQYFMSLPDFTPKHLKTLDEIRESMSKTTWLGNTETGVIQ